jgi:hypothetical protein
MKEIWKHKTDKTAWIVVVTYNEWGHRMIRTGGFYFRDFGYDEHLMCDYERIG